METDLQVSHKAKIIKPICENIMCYFSYLTYLTIVN